MGAVGISIGEGMFSIAAISTALIIVVLVLLRKVEHQIILRKRLFHYTLKTHDPAELLDQLMDSLEKDMTLDDFDVRNVGSGIHEVRLGVVTSVNGNRRLLQILSGLARDVRNSGREGSS